jgi:hypothetical protein
MQIERMGCHTIHMTHRQIDMTISRSSHRGERRRRSFISLPICSSLPLHLAWNMALLRVDLMVVFTRLYSPADVYSRETFLFPQATSQRAHLDFSTCLPLFLCFPIFQSLSGFRLSLFILYHWFFFSTLMPRERARSKRASGTRLGSTGRNSLFGRPPSSCCVCPCHRAMEGHNSTFPATSEDYKPTFSVAPDAPTTTPVTYTEGASSSLPPPPANLVFTATQRELIMEL